MTRQALTGMLATDEGAGWRPPMAETAIERAASADRDSGLVRLARGGDTEAFDALAERHLERAYRLAVAIMGSEADARDAVQDAFVSAWRHLPSLHDPARFDPWLDRIVVNACRMALRHRRVVRVREIDLGGRDGIGTPADPRLEQAGPADGVAEADLVRRAMQHLDADRRAILVLHHVEDRSVDEIATVLGIPAGTVKWRLHAARKALQRALEEESR